MFNPVYLHMCFVADQNADTIEHGEKPFVRLKIESAEEFKSYLGHIVTNLWDIYKLAATSTDSSKEVDLATLEALTHPEFLQLRAWVTEQKRLANDKALRVKLGYGYIDFVRALLDNNITLMQDVELVIGDSLDEFDRAVEVI